MAKRKIVVTALPARDEEIMAFLDTALDIAAGDIVDKIMSDQQKEGLFNETMFQNMV
jgi:hypothetical protein